jgi:hypothetical protein
VILKLETNDEMSSNGSSRKITKENIYHVRPSIRRPPYFAGRKSDIDRIAN